MTGESQLAAGRRAPVNSRRKIAAYVHILQPVPRLTLVPLDAWAKTTNLPQPMRRLLPLLSLLLLATWLPATEHCALEAAGLLAETCPDGCAATPGGKDGCDTVENGGYKLSGDTLKVPAPDLFICACNFCWIQIQLDATRELVPPSGALYERPHDWVASWQFVRRAAPPSRAPTLLCA